MKFMHLSDLHLGKRMGEFSLYEDQRHILMQILSILDQQRPDALLIAGDVYNKSTPSIEAVNLLDWFLVELARRELPVFISSGNHDSPDRLAFAARLMRKNQIYISPVYNSFVQPITLEDEYGPLDIFLLPFLKPAHLRRRLPDQKIETYTDALAGAIRQIKRNPDRRSLLTAHQFVTGSQRCESEEFSVGGADNVDAAVFEPFDYVALGHLHMPQTLANGRLRYCGSPLKYSFSEAGRDKSVTIVELGPKGTPPVLETFPLTPLRDMITLRGSYREVTDRQFYQDLPRDAFVQVTLTDEQSVPQAMGKLRAVYPNILRLLYDNSRVQRTVHGLPTPKVENRSPMELFEQFFQQQNNRTLSPQQRDYLKTLMEEVWEEEQ